MSSSKAIAVKDDSKRPRRRRRWYLPRNPFTVLAAATTLLLTWFTVSLIRLSWAWSYLFAINVVTFLLYLYDKSVAKIGLLRVPEAVLHTVTVAGGTPAAFIGQNLFRHKTVKASFRRVFWMIVIAQVVVFGLWIYLTRQTPSAG